MSIHAALVGASVWPADLVTAAVVTSSAQVYAGRRPQHVARNDREVWLEAIASPSQEGSGFQAVDVYPYLVHVRLRAPGNGGANQAGAGHVASVKALMETIARRYHGEIPFAVTFTGMLPCEAVEESVDVDPEDAALVEGTVRVTFRVRR